ncbi:MAG: 50S ribosomal protein L25 [Fimbriimonadaceae bacterium]|nr:50S ribosomal protein L25 [Fimbriimonadaceae bacterium]
MPTLQATIRETNSSAEVNRLRKSGHMPMALITPEKETRLLQANTREIRDVMRSITGVPLFDLSLDGGKCKVVVKDVQRDALSKYVTHITLQQIRDTDKIRVQLPIHVHGTPVAVDKNESTLATSLTSIEVQCIVNKMPDSVELDISHLGESDKITVGDLELPEGVEPMVSAEAVIVTTIPIRRQAEEETAVEGEEEGVEGEATESEESTEESE